MRLLNSDERLIFRMWMESTNQLREGENEGVTARNAVGHSPYKYIRFKYEGFQFKYLSIVCVRGWIKQNFWLYSHLSFSLPFLSLAHSHSFYWSATFWPYLTKVYPAHTCDGNRSATLRLFAVAFNWVIRLIACDNFISIEFNVCEWVFFCRS